MQNLSKKQKTKNKKNKNKNNTIYFNCHKKYNFTSNFLRLSKS